MGGVVTLFPRGRGWQWGDPVPPFPSSYLPSLQSTTCTRGHQLSPPRSRRRHRLFCMLGVVGASVTRGDRAPPFVPRSCGDGEPGARSCLPGFRCSRSSGPGGQGSSAWALGGSSLGFVAGRRSVPGRTPGTGLECGAGRVCVSSVVRVTVYMTCVCGYIALYLREKFILRSY